MRVPFFALVGAVLVLLPSLVFAGNDTDTAMTEASIGVELFRWQEFDNNDIRLLTEQGPRVRFNLAHNNEARITSGFLYSVGGSLYGGDVAYDGQTQNIDPNNNAPKINFGYFSAANVDYSGVSGELRMGYRFKNIFWNRSFDLLAGLGAESWTREIGSGVSSQGQTVRGLVEDYKIAYTRFALGVEKRKTIWRSLWRLGVKYPVFTKETLDSPSLELKPGKEVSAFFSYRFQLVDNGRLDQGTFVYFVYDGYRFSRSPVVSGFAQPRSNMDVVTLSIGRAF